MYLFLQYSNEELLRSIFLDNLFIGVENGFITQKKLPVRFFHLPDFDHFTDQDLAIERLSPEVGDRSRISHHFDEIGPYNFLRFRKGQVHKF